MPLQQALPTWLAINNCNFTSQSGQTDPVTGQPYNAGGLNAGDYFDLTQVLRTQFALDDAQYFVNLEVQPAEPDRTGRGSGVRPASDRVRFSA